MQAAAFAVAAAALAAAPPQHGDCSAPPQLPPPAAGGGNLSAAAAAAALARAEGCALIPGWVLLSAEAAEVPPLGDVRCEAVVAGGLGDELSEAQRVQLRAAAAALLGAPAWRVIRLVCSAPSSANDGSPRVRVWFTVWNAPAQAVGAAPGPAVGGTARTGSAWAAPLLAAVAVAAACAAAAVHLILRRRRRRRARPPSTEPLGDVINDSLVSELAELHAGAELLPRAAGPTSGRSTPRGALSGRSTPHGVLSGRSTPRHRSHSPHPGPPFSSPRSADAPPRAVSPAHRGRARRGGRICQLAAAAAAALGCPRPRCGRRCPAAAAPAVAACACGLLAVAAALFFTRGPWCWTVMDEAALLRQQQLGASGFARAVPLQRAHSHNDYSQLRPLRDALAAGFCSIEADVFLSNSTLYLGHDRPSRELLMDAYLRPLATATREHNGRVYPLSATLGVCQQVTLLVDLKAPSAAALAALDAELRAAEARERAPGAFGCAGREGAVLVLASGMRPEQLAALGAALVTDEDRCVWFDGREPAPEDPAVRSLQRQVSRSLHGLLGWGLPTRAAPPSRLSAAEAATVEAWATAVRRGGARSRLWATPDSSELWAQLLGAGVDLIGTDRIAALRGWLLGGAPLGALPAPRSHM
eukprot:TRINITY_DN14985_c0_g1_i3.p1 TRINITY_DN14985_c0_g1~~TRINITY_DN14985_c0_g1_i3.p1  ORF type:complete len:643 (+),score=145.86 TRINITY_DN14985_c0_g1_i3:72-2000(+)